jgi:hypothetical protein
LAQTNINECPTNGTNVPYCSNGSGSGSGSTITQAQFKAILNNPVPNYVEVNQNIYDYVNQQVATGGKAPKPIFSTNDPNATNVPTLPKIPDIPDIPDLQNLKYQIDSKDLYLLGDLEDLGIQAKNEILSKVPKPYQLILIVFSYFFFIGGLLYLVYLFSKAIGIDPNARVITIWEDRNDFTFYAIFLLYIVIFLFAYIIIKSQANLKNPFLFPFASTYIDLTSFRNFQNQQSQMISTIRSKYTDISFVGVTVSNELWSLEPFEPMEVDIETKLKQILASRTETKVKNGFEMATAYRSTLRQLL